MSLVMDFAEALVTVTVVAAPVLRAGSLLLGLTVTSSSLSLLLPALLGVDAKLNQYTRGKAFVDHVVSRVGMARFNAVWSGPDTLPQPAEIEDPQRWIDRIL